MNNQYVGMIALVASIVWRCKIFRHHQKGVLFLIADLSNTGSTGSTTTITSTTNTTTTNELFLCYYLLLLLVAL